MTQKIRIGDSKVLESRETPDGTMIRRRRVTSDGQHRFTTYERIEIAPLTVIKSSGRKEDFERDKILSAVHRSVGKFFRSDFEIEEVVDKTVDAIYALGTDVVTSRQIGLAILDVLANINEVAYVRFASVFHEFKTLDEFEQIIREQKTKKKQGEKQQ